MSAQPPTRDLDASRKSRRAARRAAARWARRTVLALIALAVVGAIVYSWLPKPVAVETAVARNTVLEVTVEEDGKTRVRDRFVVTAPISGNLERIHHEVGDPVASGEVIARISPPDPTLLDSHSREKAQAELAGARAEERAAERAVARASVAKEEAALTAERTRRLAASGAISTAELDRANLNEQVAEADLAAARDRRLAAAAQVAGARAVLGLGHAAGGGEVSVSSPASGKILKLVRDSAGPVEKGAPLVEVGDPRVLEVVIDVLSSDAALIASGMPVQITAWGGNYPLTGTVTRVEPAAFSRTSALGVEEQRVNVIVLLPDAPPSLGDGFRVEGKIVQWRGETLTVPANSVFRDRGRWAVYTVRDGRAHLAPIEVGKRGRLAVEVTSGLSPGDIVILHPGDQISEGRRVTAAR